MFEINKIYTRETIGIILNTNTKGGQWATGCASFNNEFYLQNGLHKNAWCRISWR